MYPPTVQASSSLSFASLMQVAHAMCTSLNSPHSSSSCVNVLAGVSSGGLIDWIYRTCSMQPFESSESPDVTGLAVAHRHTASTSQARSMVNLLPAFRR